MHSSTRPCWNGRWSRQTIFIAGSAITARREALLAIGGYDSDITRMQDRELLLRLAQRFGAQLSENIDWTKYNSENSISGRRDGYVEAYANLMRKHPNIASSYPHIPPYMITRQIIADVLKAGYRRPSRATWPTARRKRLATRCQN